MNGGKILGADKMIANIRKFASKFPDKVGAAIYAESQIEATEAARRTPVWNPARKVPKGVVPGALRASKQVSEPQREGTRIWVTISFGGGTIEYAVIVHEDPDAFHAIGQWKYLESVLQESSGFMIQRIGSRLNLNTMRVEDL